MKLDDRYIVSTLNERFCSYRSLSAVLRFSFCICNPIWESTTDYLTINNMVLGDIKMKPFVRNLLIEISVRMQLKFLQIIAYLSQRLSAGHLMECFKVGQVTPER